MKKIPNPEFFDCPYCWRACKSLSALTRHINEEHWDKELYPDKIYELGDVDVE